MPPLLPAASLSGRTAPVGFATCSAARSGRRLVGRKSAGNALNYYNENHPEAEVMIHRTTPENGAAIPRIAPTKAASRHALWDEGRGRMVTFAEAIRSNAVGSGSQP